MGRMSKHAQTMTPRAAAIEQALRAALAYHQQQDLPAALAIYQQVLEIESDNSDALHLSGVVANQMGRPDLAVDLVGRAIKRNGSVPEFYNNRGLALQASGDPLAAIADYHAALRLRPAYAEAHNNLANALRDHGNLTEAIEHYRRALRRNPAYVDAYSNLGDALRESGDLSEALALCRKALELDPAYPNGHNALANVLREQGYLDAAIAGYRRALQLNPAYAEAHNNLGIALCERDDLPAAIACHLEALRLKPDFAEAHLNLGNAWQRQGNPAAAIASYREALRLKPDYTAVYGNLTYMLQRRCEWAELDELHERIRRLVREEPTAFVSPYVFLTIPGSPAEQMACARNRVANNAPSLERLRAHLDFRFSPVDRGKSSRSKLRLGYMSSDFNIHPVASLIAEVLELHDRDRFELFGYCIGHDDGSAMRRRIVSAFDHFIVLGAVPLRDAAQQIYDDGIDILVDLNGYTGRCRPQILALRPAPIQVNYLGFSGASGAPYIDYIMTDRFVTPPDMQAFFTERCAYLPDTYMPNDRRRIIADTTPSRQECGLPETGFVFCSFTNNYKILPGIFDVWMRLLVATPGSVLWLSVERDAAGANLQREAGARGVAPERLVFAPKVPRQADHLARYRVADLFLDTLPYNAHATASDALWAGLPVLTCAGETFAARVAGSLLCAVGLPELITTTLPDYEALALRLARDPDRLAALREKLEANRLTTPLFDSTRYTRHLEQAYSRMWEGRMQEQGEHI